MASIQEQKTERINFITRNIMCEHDRERFPEGLKEIKRILGKLAFKDLRLLNIWVTLRLDD